MNHLLTSLAIAAISACSCIPAHAKSQPSDAGTHSDSALTFTQATTQESESVEPQTSKNNLAQNSDIWKYKRKFMLGYTIGTLDQKKRFGGEISSRWGASITSSIAHIYLHRSPIGGFLKFGLNIDLNLNYMNFAKGSGKISDIMHPNDDESGLETISLGRHYLTAGVAIGPTASFAPFYASSDKRLASLIFRPYFHVVPSYGAYIISEDDDTDLHNAFALWCAAGLELQWKRLIVGVEWKGSTAKYKGFVDNLISGIDEGYEAQRSHKFDVNMFNISIGFAY